MANLSNINNKFLVTTGGNVGINSTGPVLKLDVQGTASTPTPFGSAALNGVVRIASGSSNPILDIGSNSAAPYEMWLQAHVPANTYGTPISLQPLGGNVGIGTTAVNDQPGFFFDTTNNYLSINKWTESTATPAAMLHLFGKDNNINVPAIIIEGRDNPNDTRLKIAVKDPQVRFLLDEGSDAVNGYGLMTFETTAAPNAAASERGGFDFDLPGGTAMTITNTANVGIATDSPVTRLEVDSSQTNSTIKTGGLEMQSYAVNNSWYAENLYYNNGWKLRSDGYATQIYMETGGISFKRAASGSAGASVSPLTTMVLNSNGNAGIGRTAPDYKLVVSNNNAEGIEFGPGYTSENNLYQNYNRTTSAYVKETHYASTYSFLTAGGNTGNVGIGTASPGVALDIAKSGARIKLIDGTNQLNMGLWDSSNYRFEGDANRPMFFTSYQGNINFGISGGTTMTVKAIGVGIGTTGPSKKLHVVGDQLIFGNLFLQSSANGFRTVALNTTDGADNQELYLCGGATASSTRGAQVGVYGNEVSGTGGSVVIVAGNVSTGDIDFLTANTQRMIISNGGNVGIGTVDPDHKLEVVGGLALRNSNSRIYFGTNNGPDKRALEGNTAGTLLQIGESYSNTALYGDVGIGITNPQDKLHVNGDAIISSTRYGDFSVGSLDTTGYAIANVAASTNGSSAIVEFVASGGNGAYQSVVYSCYNGGGAWFYSKNVNSFIGNIEVAETNGSGSSTLIFYFRATTGSAAYTPRVMMRASPYNLVTL